MIAKRFWRLAAATARMAVVAFVAFAPGGGRAEEMLPGFQRSSQFNEQIRWTRLESGVRVLVNAPANLKGRRRTLVIYATPNGNTIEQTFGCTASKELDWRFDVQHVAAQVRRWRELEGERDIVLAIVQAPQLSWPAFRRDQREANVVIRDLATSLTQELAAERVVLSCHSGGGSFIWGYLNAVEELPESIERIILLDANYSYSDDERHGDKLLAWLRGDESRLLAVVAYDDREITFDGKKIVGPQGGTFRASERMLTRFRRDFVLNEIQHGPFRHTRGLGGQILFFVHPNPDNKILHTALVGEMNGLLHGLTLATNQEEKWGRFGGPRAYGAWVQAAPLVEPAVPQASLAADAEAVRLSLPERPADAPSGSKFRELLAALSRDERQEAIVREVRRGNVPDFLRRLKAVRVAADDSLGKRREATYFVTCDCLAVGADDDFFRVPCTPQTAVAIAEAAGCSLITAKVSDDLFAAAELKLEPQPLVVDRDSVATFFQHHQMIEGQRSGKPPGLLVAGIKKDVVLTNRLKEKPHKAAIYGWHRADGRPIQPLYVGHVDWYVDYSHGLRLMADKMIVDGRRIAVADVLKDPQLHPLLSNEGPMDAAEIRKAAGW